MRKTLNQVIPLWMSKGIFTALQSLDVPWKEEDIASKLDLIYHGNMSGQKPITPMVDGILKINETEVVTDNILTLLAETCLSINKVSWLKQWNTLSLNYNPISNYDMTETETSGMTNTSTGSSNTTSGGNASVYGFNSSEGVKSNEDSNTSTSSTSSSDIGNSTRTLTRSGNIGVTTSQQMLESERELWMWNFFYDVVFKDLDKVLVLKIYE